MRKMTQGSLDDTKRVYEPYFSFDGERVTFDSERYQKDFRSDINEILGIEYERT